MTFKTNSLTGTLLRNKGLIYKNKYSTYIQMFTDQLVFE